MEARNAIEGALAALWRDARYRLYSPRHVWTWLDLNRRFELRFVRKGQLKVELPRGIVPDCEACTDLCCTGPNAVVSLRLRDIAALLDAGLERHITFDRPAHPPVGTWAAREAQWSVFSQMFPVLARDATGTCTLLSDERTCSAYPAWPLSCARYPYALDALRGRLFLARGCGSQRFVSAEDPPDKVKGLVDAALRSYNERIKDIILLHVALEELTELGLTPWLRLPPALARRAERHRARQAGA